MGEDVSIHDGTNMAVPLFHGTSTIFLSSIQSRGLGETNPNKALNTIEILKDVVDIIERNWPQESVVEIFAARRMLDQQVNEYSNFRHNHVYLHASKNRAYATLSHTLMVLSY